MSVCTHTHTHTHTRVKQVLFLPLVGATCHW